MHFSAKDKAGNHRTARRIFLFDDQQTVTKQDGYSTLVTSASPDSNYQWVIVSTSSVSVSWADRFINTRHYVNNWLGAVNDAVGIDSTLDDHEGERQTTAIHNIKGRRISTSCLLLMVCTVISISCQNL